MVTVCVLKSPRGATAFLLLARNPGSSEMEESFFKESTNTRHGIVDMARYRAENDQMCFLCFMSFCVFFQVKKLKKKARKGIV